MMPRRVEPQFDRRLIGVWSRGLLGESGDADDVRILFGPNFSGRYETWHNGLNEVITFNWSVPTVDSVTLAGLEYWYREEGTVRRAPCDWHFEAVRYSISGEKRVLELHFGGKRVDRFVLMSETVKGFEEPRF
jgi:hypothetical protein